MYRQSNSSGRLGVHCVGHMFHPHDAKKIQDNHNNNNSSSNKYIKHQPHHCCSLLLLASPCCSLLVLAAPCCLLLPAQHLGVISSGRLGVHCVGVPWRSISTTSSQTSRAHPAASEIRLERGLSPLWFRLCSAAPGNPCHGGDRFPNPRLCSTST